MKYKLVYIEWYDAMANISSWMDEEEAIEWANDREGLIMQVGWVVRETKSYILIASRLGQINEGSLDLGGVFKIPTKWVKKKEVITSLSSFENKRKNA